MEISSDALKAIRVVNHLGIEVIALEEKKSYNKKIKKECSHLIMIVIDSEGIYQYTSYWKTIKPFIMAGHDLHFENNTGEDYIDAGKRYYIEFTSPVDELFQYSDEHYYKMMEIAETTHSENARTFLQFIKDNRIST